MTSLSLVSLKETLPKSDFADYRNLIKKNYPKEIYDIWSASYTIFNNGLELTIHSEDGRVNSSLNETQIIRELCDNLPEIVVSKARNWCDITYKGFPINIKITSGGSSDNCFNKKSLVFSLSQHSVIPSSMNMNELKTLLDKPKPKRDFKEYYFLVFFKTKKLPLIKSLLDIQNFKSNPSNILQINWTKEYDAMSRFNLNQDINVILKKIMQIVQKSCQEISNQESNGLVITS